MLRTRHVAALAAATLLALYGGSARAAAAKSVVALVSYSTCSYVNGKLKACTIGNKVLTPPAVKTVVPMRTHFEVKLGGSCQTLVPRVLKVELPGEAPVNFYYMQQTSFDVRHRNGAPAQQVTLTDTTPQISAASFDPSCVITAEVTHNEPDVRSKYEAENVIKALAKDLADKQQEAAAYKQLLQFAQAYDLMNQLASYLLNTITTGGMETLIRYGQQHAALLQKIIMDSSGVLTTAERIQLMDIYAAVSSLDEPEHWFTTKGGPAKNLLDHLDSNSKAILQTLEKVMKQGKGLDEHEALSKKATQQAVALEQDLAFAKIQLASWLNK
jgi:hypothetical protein